MANKPITPDDLTAARHRLSGGNAQHTPQMVGILVVCSCGKWQSKPCVGAYTAIDARRDFDAHVNFAKPVNVDAEDFDAKRKAWGLTNEQMLEMAASVFQCVRCRKEYLGSECHVRTLGAREGELVSLERSWTLQCPNKKCRGELVRVRGASEILDKGRKFFSRLFDKRVQ